LSGRIDPAAHRGLDRKIEVADQNLSISKRRRRGLDDLKMLGLGNAGRARFQADLAIGLRGCRHDSRLNSSVDELRGGSVASIGTVFLEERQLA
jgi:hypothetical protein